MFLEELCVCPPLLFNLSVNCPQVTTVARMCQKLVLDDGVYDVKLCWPI